MQVRVRRRASELGVSLAEYVRRLVARDLGQPEQRGDPSVIFGLGNSRGTDIAKDKDALIGAAVAQQGRRRKAKR